MSLNILGGKLRGIPLKLSPTIVTRPTQTTLKRRIFDSHQDLSSRTFIDLFAGTGSIAFEALSRGADEVWCVEIDHKAIRSLEENIKIILKKSADPLLIHAMKMDAFKFLEKNLHLLNSKTIIYLDPPYEDKKSYEIILNFLKSHLFSGEVWLESCRQKGFEIFEIEKILGEKILKIYNQGTSYLGIVRFNKG